MNREELKKVFASKLLMWMQECEFTQKTLSDITGIPQPRISNYVNGKHLPNKVNMLKLSEALGCKERDLLPRAKPVAEVEAFDIKLDKDFTPYDGGLQFVLIEDDGLTSVSVSEEDMLKLGVIEEALCRTDKEEPQTQSLTEKLKGWWSRCVNWLKR